MKRTGDLGCNVGVRNAVTKISSEFDATELYQSEE